MDSRAPLWWWPGDTWIGLNDRLTSTPIRPLITIWSESTGNNQGIGVGGDLVNYWRLIWQSGPIVCIARQICICEYSTKRVLDLKTGVQGVQVESNAEVKNAFTVSYSWHFFVWPATGDLLSIDFRVFYIYFVGESLSLHFMTTICILSATRLAVFYDHLTCMTWSRHRRDIIDASDQFNCDLCKFKGASYSEFTLSVQVKSRLGKKTSENTNLSWERRLRANQHIVTATGWENYLCDFRLDESRCEASLETVALAASR